MCEEERKRNRGRIRKEIGKTYLMPSYMRRRLCQREEEEKWLGCIRGRGFILSQTGDEAWWTVNGVEFKDVRRN